MDKVFFSKTSFTLMSDEWFLIEKHTLMGFKRLKVYPAFCVLQFFKLSIRQQVQFFPTHPTATKKNTFFDTKSTLRAMTG